MLKKKKQQPTHELSEIAKRHNIRVSTPHGYYPDDVDKLLSNYESVVNQLQSETKRLSEQLEQSRSDCAALRAEVTKLQLDMSNLEIPDVSANESFAMLSKLENISDEVNTTVDDLDENVKEHINLNILEPDTFDDLVTPVKKENTSALSGIADLEILT